MAESLAYAFDHVHIYCSDLAASERWFIEGMGAEFVRRREVRGAPATDLRLAGVRLFLRGTQLGEVLGEAGPSRFGTDHIGLAVQDLGATAQELKRRGVEFETEPQVAGTGLRIAFVRGPDRVRIELVQRA